MKKNMSVDHIARSGKTYYLHVTTGPKGKAKYFFSTISDGLLAQAIPDGYEIYETINAQVFLRRKTMAIIQPDEYDLIQSVLEKKPEKWKYRSAIRKDMIVIHEACQEYDWIDLLPVWVDKAKAEQMKIQNTTYMPIMRFVLEHREKRILRAERFCFKGSIDDWIMIGLPATLNVLAKEFIRHLGKESFFDLM
jgi:hypothetical protein